MRLTLRTLLAFIDEQLSEDDATELGGRIEKSEHAKRLQRRICMLATRRNVPAPQLDVRGVGEMNEVSNYLDSTMPAEKVADFEKACLESDIHLSEVAACHNILTMLGTSDDIEPELRRRLYLLNKFPVDSTISENDANIEQHGAIAERFVDSGDEKIVPGRGVFELSPPADFDESENCESPSDDITGMRDRLDNPKVRWRVIPVMATVASLLLLTFLILYATRDTGQNESRVDDDSEEKVAATVSKQDTNTGSKSAANSTDEVADARDVPENKQDSPKEDSASDSSSDPGAVIAAPSAPALPVPDPIEPDTKLPAKDEPKIAKAETAVANVDANIAKDDPGEELNDARSAARLAFFGIEAKEPGREAAKFVSADELIGKVDLRTGKWRAIGKGEALMEHQYLLAMPVFRPSIEFAKVAVIPCGAGVFQILPFNDKGVPAIQIHSGRFLLNNLTGSFNEFSIVAGDLSGTVTLQSPDSIVAIEVTRVLPRGADPLSYEAVRSGETILEITGVAGRSMWVDKAEVVQLDEKVSRVNSTREKSENHTLDTLPSWIDEESTSNLTQADRVATRALVTGQQDIVDAFQRIANSEDAAIEVRSRQIAQLCLLHLGEASALPRILDNPDRSYIRIPLWREAMRLGKLAMNRSTVAAAQFKQSMEAADPDGGKLFAMLRGFSNDQLAAGADAQLVEALKHERQVMRVAALQTLYGITGKNLRFRPETDENIRKRNIGNWEEALKEGVIRYPSTE